MNNIESSLMIDRNVVVKYPDQFKDKNGVLLELNTGIQYSSDCYNLIYINGSQFEHYNKYGNSIFNPMTKHMYGHIGEWYNESFKPYIFKFRVNNDADDSYAFATSLESMLHELKNTRSIIIGRSYGACIAARLIESALVEQVYAMSPVFSGSVLSDIETLKNYKKTLSDLIPYIGARFVLEPKKAFTHEIYKGIDVIANGKMQAFGGSIEGLIPNNIYEWVLHKSGNLITGITGDSFNDGMVVFKKEYFEKRNIPFTNLAYPYHNLEISKNSKIIFDKINEDFGLRKVI